MSTNSSLVMFAMCGVSLVCLGVLGVMLFVLLRATGDTFISPMLALLRRDAREDALDESAAGRRAVRSVAPSQTFQAKAQSVDFDSAVEKYRQQGAYTPGAPVAPTAAPVYPAQNAPPQYPAPQSPPISPVQQPQPQQPRFPLHSSVPPQRPPANVPPAPPNPPANVPPQYPQRTAPPQYPAPQNPALPPQRPPNAPPPALPPATPQPPALAPRGTPPSLRSNRSSLRGQRQRHDDDGGLDDFILGEDE